MGRAPVAPDFLRPQLIVHIKLLHALTVMGREPEIVASITTGFIARVAGISQFFTFI